MFLVLGAGKDQCHMIRRAQANNHYVLTVDFDPNAPGFKIADDHAVISNRDAESIARMVADYPHEIRGVSSMGSEVADVVCRITEQFGLPSTVSDWTARHCRDKQHQKSILSSYGIAVPIQVPINAINTVPSVFKPNSGSGARDVIISKQGKGLELPHHVYGFVERYIEGPQFSTEAVFCKGEMLVNFIADRNYDNSVPDNPAIENGGTMPCSLPVNKRKILDALIVRCAEAIGLKSGTLKGDIVWGPDGPVVIEVHPRLSGGDFSESLIPLSTGIEIVDMAIDLAVDGVTFRPYQKWTQYVANRYLFLKPGQVKSFSYPKRIDYDKIDFPKPGDILRPIQSHADRHGVFVVSADSREELNEKIEAVYDGIKYETEPVREVA